MTGPEVLSETAPTPKVHKTRSVLYLVYTYVNFTETLFFTALSCTQCLSPSSSHRPLSRGKASTPQKKADSLPSISTWPQSIGKASNSRTQQTGTDETRRREREAASYHNTKAKPEQPEKSMATTSHDYEKTYLAFNVVKLAWFAAAGGTEARS